MSSHPTVTFQKYTDASNTHSDIATGGVCTLTSTVSANTWSSDLALRIKFTRGSSFTVNNVRIWMNDTTATLNGGEVDISDWDYHHKYTGAAGVSVGDMQSEGVACVAAAITTGDQAGWAALPVDSVANAITLTDMTAAIGAATSVWSRFVGLSFRPTVSAQDGTYTNFSCQVKYEFS